MSIPVCALADVCRIIHCARQGEGGVPHSCVREANDCMYQTGQTAPYSGAYRFDGYVDGAQAPLPAEKERMIVVIAGETFPPIRSVAKSCWWNRA